MKKAIIVFRRLQLVFSAYRCHQTEIVQYGCNSPSAYRSAVHHRTQQADALIPPHAVTVRAWLGDRRKNVRHGHDARTNRYALFLQMERITVAVQPLMME